MASEEVALKPILKTGDSKSKKHSGGIKMQVEEGHDAEKKEHKVLPLLQVEKVFSSISL